MFINLETPNFLISSHQHATHQQTAAAGALTQDNLVKPVHRNAIPRIKKKRESRRVFWRKLKTDQGLQAPKKELQEYGESGIDTVI